jgi:hypothetical protein
LGNHLTASGVAIYIGGPEAYASKSKSAFYGLVDANWNGTTQTNEVTVKPHYEWRN